MIQVNDKKPNQEIFTIFLNDVSSTDLKSA